MLRAAAIDALPHRRAVAHVISNLIDNLREAARAGMSAYFTVCHETAKRGRQHRNTVRVIIRELHQTGILHVYGGVGVRPRCNYRTVRLSDGSKRVYVSRNYAVRWAVVWQRVKQRNLHPMHAPVGTKVRTKAQWDAEQAAAAAERVRRANAAQAAGARLAARLAGESQAASPAARLVILRAHERGNQKLLTIAKAHHRQRIADNLNQIRLDIATLENLT
jgi:hypothetical protein